LPFTRHVGEELEQQQVAVEVCQPPLATICKTLLVLRHGLRIVLEPHQAIDRFEQQGGAF
jgi:hypothetical protein